MRLVDIAHARSGDKGDRADIGVFARNAKDYTFIKQLLTAPRIAAHFRGISSGAVDVWPLDNLWAIKIVLNNALQGNAARSLRSDNLGKCLAAALLRMEIDNPQGNPHE